MAEQDLLADQHLDEHSEHWIPFMELGNTFVAMDLSGGGRCPLVMGFDMALRRLWRWRIDRGGDD